MLFAGAEIINVKFVENIKNSLLTFDFGMIFYLLSTCMTGIQYSSCFNNK